MHLPLGLRARLRQRGEEQLPILVVPEDVFPPAAAIPHVINRARIFQAQFSRQAPIDAGIA
jgi:hypothetical protein